MPRRQSKYLLILISIITLLAVLSALIWWLKPTTPTQVTSPDTQVATTPQMPSTGTLSDDTERGGEVRAATRTGFVTGLEQMPRSLQDTEVDGEIIIDENQQLVVTEGLRRLFDYFLSAMGEEDEATIIARVEAYIRHHTPEPAASDAIAIFHQYVDYLKSLEGIESNYGNLQMQATQRGEMDLNLIAQRRQDIADLRQQFFDEQTIEAFYGAEDAYDDYSIAMMRIMQDETLSETQKQAAREDYISRLPDNSLKQSVQQQDKLGQLIERTEALKAQGASQQELFAMRRELVGEAAAIRLAEVDAEDADFDARFTQYQTQRQRLIAQAGSQIAAQAQIDELEKQLFSDSERKRLSGYAALKQLKQQNQQ